MPRHRHAFSCEGTASTFARILPAHPGSSPTMSGMARFRLRPLHTVEDLRALEGQSHAGPISGERLMQPLPRSRQQQRVDGVYGAPLPRPARREMGRTPLGCEQSVAS